MADTLKIPITITNGRAASLEQDTPEEVAQAAATLLGVRGAPPDLDYSFDPTFTDDVATVAAEAVAIIDEYEPRMDPEARGELADGVARILVEG